MFVLQEQDSELHDTWHDRQEAHELVDLAQEVAFSRDTFRVLYRETDDSQPFLEDGDIAYRFKGGPGSANCSIAALPGSTS